jgi:hypothetical protein
MPNILVGKPGSKRLHDRSIPNIKIELKVIRHEVMGWFQLP